MHFREKTHEGGWPRGPARGHRIMGNRDRVDIGRPDRGTLVFPTVLRRTG
jgi:hypothetical protein